MLKLERHVSANHCRGQPSRGIDIHFNLDGDDVSPLRRQPQLVG
jgi:hypothetical protein